MTSLECFFRILFHIKGFKEELNKELDELGDFSQPFNQLLLAIHEILIQIEDNKNDEIPLDLNGIRNILFNDDYTGEKEKETTFPTLFSNIFSQILKDQLRFFEYENSKYEKKQIYTGVKTDNDIKNKITNDESLRKFKKFIAVQYDQTFVPEIDKFSSYNSDYELIAGINFSETSSVTYLIKNQSKWTFFDDGLILNFDQFKDIQNNKIPINFQIFSRSERKHYIWNTSSSTKQTPYTSSSTTHQTNSYQTRTDSYTKSNYQTSATNYQIENHFANKNVKIIKPEEKDSYLNIYNFYYKPTLQFSNLKITDENSLAYDLKFVYKLKKDYKRLFYFDGNYHKTLTSYDTKFNLDVYDYLASQENELKKYLKGIKSSTTSSKEIQKEVLTQQLSKAYQNEIKDIKPPKLQTSKVDEQLQGINEQIIYFFSGDLSIRKMEYRRDLKNVKNRSDLTKYARTEYGIMNADILCVNDVFEVYTPPVLDPKYKIIIVQGEIENQSGQTIYNCVFITKHSPTPVSNGICFRFAGGNSNFAQQISKAFGTKSKLTIYQWNKGKEQFIASMVRNKYTIHIEVSENWKLSLT